MRLQVLSIFAVCSALLSSFRVEAAGSWPFDQRTILLAKTEGNDFPDDLTTAQVLDVFVRRGRVRWVFQRGGRGQIVPVEIPRDFPWQSSLSVKQLGLRYKVDGVVLLRQKGMEIDLRWYGTADGEPLFFENVKLPAAGPRPEEENLRKKRISDWVEDIWLRIPGRGYVVKRDMTTLNIEGAAAAGVKVGDTLEIRRLEQARRHPLLKTLIGISSSMSGLATVTQVDEPFSTAKIDFESSADPIQEGDRYDIRPAAGTQPALPGAAPGAEAKTEQVKTADGRVIMPLLGDKKKKSAKDAEEEDENVSDDQEPASSPAKIIDVTGRLTWSSLTHNETTSAGNPTMSGSGVGLDAVLRGYITRTWVVDAHFGFSQVALSDSSNLIGTDSLSAHVMNFRIAPAYRFIFLEDPNTPGEFSFSVGYQSFNFSVGQSDKALAPVSKSYSGLDFGLQVRVPVVEKFSVFGGVTRIVSLSLTESPKTTGAASTDDAFWSFEAGLAYQVQPDSFLTGGIQSMSSSSNFTGTGTRTTAALSNSISLTNYFVGYAHRF
ncbi:MAG: hypothetical protein JST16_07555 [Bdellovibrionales bacterium]|nr:hypothetical protein [Bdellovibrionales bacterium]